MLIACGFAGCILHLLRNGLCFFVFCGVLLLPICVDFVLYVCTPLFCLVLVFGYLLVHLYSVVVLHLVRCLFCAY